MVKDDNKPRGRMSAYAFFVQTYREEIKKKNPAETVVFTEFSRRCADRWKNMSEKEKQKFTQLAEKDKKRYAAEMANYEPVAMEKAKKRKRTKDPNAPKKSLSAFFFFLNDERPKVKGNMPDLAFGAISKEIARRWTLITPETRAKYDAMAAKDKVRYTKEVKAYTNSKASKASSSKGKKIDSDEESDDEDDDDEDDDE